MIQHFINHIALVVDRSQSMAGKPVATVIDRELARLKQRSVEMGQETRVSIYLFNGNFECLVFDMDVMRFESMVGHYQPAGNTALVDAVVMALDDQKILPEAHGDHAFLLYVITDGEENCSRKFNSVSVMTRLEGLPENWTVACLVPDTRGIYEAKRFGFPARCISQWDTKSAEGFQEVGKQFSRVVDNYMTMRSTGVRGTKSLFTLNVDKLGKTPMIGAKALPLYDFDRFQVYTDTTIQEFVEKKTGRAYVNGSTYYELTKKVQIQDHKNLIVEKIDDGKFYEGRHLRQLLGLPNHTVTVSPKTAPGWRIFVQSKSYNRKLIAGTSVIVKGRI